MGKWISQIAGNRANRTRRTRHRREAGQNSGSIGNTTTAPGIDGVLNSVWRASSGVIENICEELVVKDPVTRADDGLVVPKKTAPEMRCIGQAHAWSEIVFVPLLLASENSGEIRGSTQSDAELGIERWEWQRVFERVLIFVAQAEVNREILPKVPGILNVRRVG